MHILVVGGSGYVASLVLPTLARHHTVRVFDRRAPAEPWEYVEGDIGDIRTLRRAAEGTDALLYMAMGSKEFGSDEAVATNFDVNVKGVYLAVQAAHEAGARHAVYTSSMSVYDGDLLARGLGDESIPPDSTHFYGLSKRLGEEVCRSAVAAWGMSVVALRLCLPTPDDRWLAETRLGAPTIATPASDLARVLVAALDYQGHGFQAFTVSGDYEQRVMNMAKAKRVLGWEPLLRPEMGDGE
jgi:nucleoside-diphosphate-sugar epimerase